MTSVQRVHLKRNLPLMLPVDEKRFSFWNLVGKTAVHSVNTYHVYGNTPSSETFGLNNLTESEIWMTDIWCEHRFCTQCQCWQEIHVLLSPLVWILLQNVADLGMEKEQGYRFLLMPLSLNPINCFKTSKHLNWYCSMSVVHVWEWFHFISQSHLHQWGSIRCGNVLVLTY
jgi:hypothetical protein